MKKLRLFLRNIPRKAKILLNLALILLLAFWIYLLLGSPAHIKTLYRRAEKANLVGPGTILAVLESPGLGYEHVVLAEDGNFVMVYSRDREDARRTQFVYRERTQGIALLSLPADSSEDHGVTTSLPIFLFDGYSDAIRAELTLSLPDDKANSPVLHARREAAGYFRFALSVQELADTQGELLRRLQLLSKNTMADTGDKTLTAVIKLYDSGDTLLAEITSTVDNS